MTGNVSNITTKMTRSATPIEDTIAPDFARIIVEIILPPAYIAQDNLIFILYVHRFVCLQEVRVNCYEPVRVFATHALKGAVKI